jgi:hypothetical protein
VGIISTACIREPPKQHVVLDMLCKVGYVLYALNTTCFFLFLFPWSP